MWPLVAIIAGLWALIQFSRKGSVIAPRPGTGSPVPPLVVPPPGVTPADPPPPPPPPAWPPWSAFIYQGLGIGAYADICSDGTPVASTVRGSGGAGEYRFGDTAIRSQGEGMFIRAVNGHNRHYAIGKMHSPGNGELVCMETGRTVDLGATHGNYCVALEVDGQGVWAAWAQASGGTVIGLKQHFTPDLDAIGPPELTNPCPPELQPTSQGFDDLIGGQVLWKNAGRRFRAEGVVLAQPSTRDTWTAGQADTPGFAPQIVVVETSTHSVGTIYLGNAYEPHMVLAPDGRRYVACRTQNEGAFFYQIPPFPSLRGSGGAGGGPTGLPPVDIAPFGEQKVVGAFLFSGEPVGLSNLNAKIKDPFLRRQDGSPILPWFDLAANDRAGGSWADIARQPIPTLFYFDSADIPPNLWPNFRPGDVFSFPAYRSPGEPIGTFETRVASVIDQSITRGLTCVPIAGAYRRLDTLTVAQVVECFPVYRRIADRFGCRGLIFFGVNRLDGTVQNPIFLDWIKAFVSPLGLPGFAPAQGPPGGGGPTPLDDGYVPLPSWPSWSVSGDLETIGSVIKDDRGDHLWIGASFFSALWAWKFDRDRCLSALHFLADQGLTYIRIFGAVGPSGWTDRAIDPTWPDYESNAAGLIDTAAGLGLRTQVTLIAGTELLPSQRSRQDFVHKWIRILSGRQEKVFIVEISNEGFKNFPDTAENKRLAQIVRVESPLLVATSAPPGDQSKIWYGDGGPANIGTVHLDRDTGGTGREWRPVRQPWEVQFYAGFPRAWICNEPIGPQSSVAEDDDPMRLAMTAAIVWQAGGGAYTLHTGPGVRFGGVEDLARGRVANFQQVNNIEAILDGLRSVRGLLPPSLPNWQHHNAHWPGHPFQFQGGLEPAIASEAILRAYASTNGAELIVMPIRILGPSDWVAKSRMAFKVIHPLTRDVLFDVSLDGGQRFTLPPVAPAVIMMGSQL